MYHKYNMEITNNSNISKYMRFRRGKIDIQLKGRKKIFRGRILHLILSLDNFGQKNRACLKWRMKINNRKVQLCLTNNLSRTESQTKALYTREKVTAQTKTIWDKGAYERLNIESGTEALILKKSFSMPSCSK